MVKKIDRIFDKKSNTFKKKMKIKIENRSTIRCSEYNSE